MLVPEELFLRSPTEDYTAYLGTKYWVDPGYQDIDRQRTLDELYLLIADTKPADDTPDSQIPDGVYLKYVHDGDVQNGQLYIWGGAAWVGPLDRQSSVPVAGRHLGVFFLVFCRS